MRKYSDYQCYRNDVAPWLGDVPTEWVFERGKWVHTYSKILNSSGENQNVLSLTLRGVVNNDPENPEGLIPSDYRTYQVFDKDNLVFKLIDLENVKTSRVGLVHENGIMSSAYIRIIPSKETNPKFLYYFYFHLYQGEVFNKLGSGVRSTLNKRDLLDLHVPVLSKETQAAIAGFLDDKVGKIEALVAIKKAQIALLKERKQILIQEAVTKGLNPDAPMKDSGIDWIGQIPAHWEVKRIKHLLTERNERSEDGEEPLLMVSQVHGLVVRADFHSKAEVSASNVGNKIVHENDLVFNKLKAHLGVFFKSNISSLGIVSPDYAVYTPSGDIPDSKYFELLFRHPAYIAQFIVRATGIVEGLIRLYTSELFDIPIAVPPKGEQAEIISFIHNVSEKFDDAINIKENQITKLNEYKVTLINAAVTGKIKVPEQYFSKDV